ncbi:Homeobox protein HD-10 [Nosema granulosis]|uniref:Homeobox protein HD-10 n=1 Tax=Nosema granulosis TaxID=83296 RepID=A0A9P6KZE4_9MICR|nr:Homeobox protein HD-10 [Nosema granulosis]
MDNYRGHYFDSFTRTQQGEVKNQYYDPFYVKHRKRTTKAQLRVLEKTFETCPRPDSLMRKKLGEQLGMTPRSVQVWFQNRRAKIKKQQQGGDSRLSPILSNMEQRGYKRNIEDFDLYPTNNSLTRVPIVYQNRTIQNHNYYHGDQAYYHYSNGQFNDQM